MKTNSTTSFWKQLRLPLVVAATLSSLPMAYADSYSDTVKADSPTAYYRMEESAGSTTFADTMGNYPGEWTYDTDESGNPAYPKLEQPGLEVNAAVLHPYTDAAGTAHSSYGRIPWSDALNPSAAYTVELWVRPTSGSSTYHTPMASVGSDINTGWLIGQTDSAWIWCLKYGGVWMQAGTVNLLHWHHLVATYDGTTVIFYVNGAEVTRSTFTGYQGNNGGDMIIGGITSSGLNYDGSIDEIALYDKVLTPDRIQTHYSVGLTNIKVVATAPSIISSPADATAYVGRTATFGVTADGTAPLSYQWYKGSTPIPDATNKDLTVTCTLADNGTTYKVDVTNSLGKVTSGAATLTASTDLILVGSPVSVTRFTGSKAGFYVEAGGALPFSYQWYKGSSAIANATNAMLWLSNVATTDDGTTYYAKVSNGYNTTNSEAATLTITARPATVPVTGNAKIVMADDPIAYWRLDESAGSDAVVDAAGSFNGAYDDAAGAGSFAFQDATGVPNESDTALGVTKGARVLIPWAPELNPHGAFSVEAWVKPATASTGESGDYRTAFSSESDDSLPDNPTGWLMYQTPNNTWTWVVFKGYWNADWLTAASVPIVAGDWYHIVLTSDGSLFNFYINGALQVSQVVDGYVPNRNGPVDLGWRTLHGDFPPFDGTIDEVAIYSKELTLAQVQTHYQHSVAPSTITASRSGADVVLTWTSGTLQEADKVNGTFTDVSTGVSPYTVTPNKGATKFYRLKGQ